MAATATSASLKNMTSQLTGRFVTPAISATREQFGGGTLTRYRANLVVPEEQRSEVAVLKAPANLFVFQRPNAAAIYERQREVVPRARGCVECQRPG